MPHSISHWCGQPNAVNNNNLGAVYISNKNCDLGMVYDIGSTTLYTIYLGKTLLFNKSEIANMLLEKSGLGQWSRYIFNCRCNNDVLPSMNGVLTGFGKNAKIISWAIVSPQVGWNERFFSPSFGVGQRTGSLLGHWVGTDTLIPSSNVTRLWNMAHL